MSTGLVWRRAKVTIWASLRVTLLATIAMAQAETAPSDVATTNGLAIDSALPVQTFSSGVNKTSLLELYTSQGCYSCPPAEQWLNDLSAHKGLWSEVVPIALHVDYWDYLGWKDPYSDIRNQKRHYSYRSQGHTKGIYTPEMILNGEDWLLWRKGVSPSFDNATQAGVLGISVEGDQVTLRFKSANGKTPVLRANIALLGFGIETSINAGENKGKVLAHEFVALSQDSKLGHPVGSLYQWSFAMPVSDHLRERDAIVAWLDVSDNNQPIQATGGWLK